MKVDWFKTVQFLFAGQFCLKVIWRFRMELHETAKASNRNGGLKLLLIYIYKKLRCYASCCLTPMRASTTFTT